LGHKIDDDKSQAFRGESSFHLPSLKFLESLSILGIVLFIFSTAFPPLDLLAQINLAIHMGQHVLIALSGVMIAYPFYLRRKARGILPSKHLAALSVIVVAAIVIFWHLPTAWDSAVLNPLIHGIEHISFLTVGLIIGWFFPVLADNYKFMLIFLTASGHMVYGIFLYVSNTPVYPLYPVSQQALLGVLLLFPAPLYFIISIAYSLDRETTRLEQLDLTNESDLLLNTSTRKVSNSQPKLRSVIIPVITLLLIVIFVGYLAVVGGMIYTSYASDPPRGSAVVYILETPVTWQYSPQNIVVVVGVNNTVTWISHSLSEDTVTSNNGLFDSGILNPGQSWTFTFSKVGTYPYSCTFHPWMKGTITVLSSN
jgi:plastocyanin